MKQCFKPQWSLFLFLAIFTFPDLSAQTSEKLTRIRGTIIDKETKEPLPFVNISFPDAQGKGTTTDFDGNYEISSQWVSETMVVSYLGYIPYTTTVKLGERQVIDIELEPESLNLKEVVIKAKKKKYRKRGNPAVELMRKVIANKQENDLTSYDYYEHDKYEKVQMDINNITDKFRQRKVFKKFQFIFDNVDTSEINGKPYLPFFLQEIASKVYYQKEGNRKREYRSAVKATKLENYLDEKSITTIMDYLYEEVNIYEGSVLLLGNQFTTPLADIAPDFYRFYIIDTVDYNGKQAVDMAFIPKVKGNFGFSGNLKIALDSSYQVLHVEMGIVDDIILNFVQDLYVEQEFKEGPDGKYVKSKDRIVVDYNLTKKGIGAFGKRTVLYYNHKYNQPADPEIYDGIELLHEDEDARKVTDEYWDANRPLELSESEANTYEMIDTLKQVPAFKRALNLMSLLITGYTPVGKFDVGPIVAFYNFNSVEGFRLRFGGRTNLKFAPKLRLDSYLAYGFKDKRFKGALTGLYSFEENWQDNPKHFVRFGYTRETKFPSLTVEFVNEDNFFLSFMRGAADKMLEIDSWRGEYFKETRSNLTFNLVMERLRQRPLGALNFDFIDTNGEPASLDAIRTTELTTTVRFAPNAEYFQGKINRFPISNEHPVFQLSYNTSIENLLGSEYSYHKLQFKFFKRFYLSILGFTNIDMEAGKIWGDNLPYVLLHSPRANQTFTLQRRAFNNMNFIEFVSDEYVQLNLRHYFNGFIFNRIPLFKRLKLREVVTFKAIYGRLSDSNNPETNPNAIIFPQRPLFDDAGEPLLDANGQQVYQQETFAYGSKPYVEASFGILNVFKFLRLETIKRFTYLDHPNVPTMFGVKGLALRARVYVEF